MNKKYRKDLPIPDCLCQEHADEKSAKTLRKGFTMIEVVIAMVLLSVIFLTFMMAVVATQKVVTKSGTITDFMFETSQATVDAKIDRLNKYISLRSSKKLYEASDSGNLSEEDKKKVQEINDALNALELDQSDGSSLFANIEQTGVDYSGGVDRHVDYYVMSSSLSNYKRSRRPYTLSKFKGALPDEDLQQTNTDNETYKFGKFGGASYFYYQLANVDIKPYVVNRAKFAPQPVVAYMGDTVTGGMKKPSGSNRFEFFPYWWVSRSKKPTATGASGESSSDYSEYYDTKRSFFPAKYNYDDANGTSDTTREYCPEKLYERVQDASEATLLIDERVHDLTGGKFLRFTAQPATGTVGAAFDNQFSPYYTYVFPFKLKGNMRSNLQAHFEANILGIYEEAVSEADLPYADSKQLQADFEKNAVVAPVKLEIKDTFSSKDRDLGTGGVKINPIYETYKPFDVSMADKFKEKGVHERRAVYALEPGDSAPNKNSLQIPVGSLYESSKGAKYFGAYDEAYSKIPEASFELFGMQPDDMVSYLKPGGGTSKYSAILEYFDRLPMAGINSKLLTAKQDNVGNIQAIQRSINTQMLLSNNVGYILERSPSSGFKSGAIFLKFMPYDIAGKIFPLEDASGEIAANVNEVNGLGLSFDFITERVLKGGSGSTGLKDKFSDSDNKDIAHGKFVTSLFSFVNNTGHVDRITSIGYCFEEQKDAQNKRTLLSLPVYFTKTGGKGYTKHEYFGKREQSIIEYKDASNADKLMSVIEPGAINTAVLFYKIDVPTSNAEFALLINGCYLGKINTRVPAKPYIAVGGPGNLNMIEMLHVNLNDIRFASRDELVSFMKSENLDEIDVYTRLAAANSDIISDISKNTKVIIDLSSGDDATLNQNKKELADILISEQAGSGPNQP